jgi:hypothetical protein
MSISELTKLYVSILEDGLRMHYEDVISAQSRDIYRLRAELSQYSRAIEHSSMKYEDCIQSQQKEICRLKEICQRRKLQVAEVSNKYDCLLKTLLQADPTSANSTTKEPERIGVPDMAKRDLGDSVDMLRSCKRSRKECVKQNVLPTEQTTRNIAAPLLKVQGTPSITDGKAIGIVCQPSIPVPAAAISDSSKQHKPIYMIKENEIVRNRAQRATLPGHTCSECAKYVEALIFQV